MPFLRQQNAAHLNLLHSRRHWQALHNPPTSCLIIVRSHSPCLKCRTIHTPPWTTGTLIPSLRVRAVLKGILDTFAIWLGQECTVSEITFCMLVDGIVKDTPQEGASCLGLFRPECMHVKVAQTTTPSCSMSTVLGITLKVCGHHLIDENVSIKEP